MSTARGKLCRELPICDDHLWYTSILMPIVEMTGKRYGKLRAIRRVENDAYGNAQWLCKCDCGSTTTVKGQHLRTGNTKACGCLAAAKDISGKRFGRLTAIKLFLVRGGKHIWIFRCDCGIEVTARKSHVLSGGTKSCGCLKREESVKRFTTHGMTGATEYNIWMSMLARCNNPKHSAYKNYGGRGINVCRRWSKFENFYADMGPRPKARTLDRIDNDGNYEPSNCRWTTWKQQASNRRPQRPNVQARRYE